MCSRSNAMVTTPFHVPVVVPFESLGETEGFGEGDAVGEADAEGLGLGADGNGDGAERGHAVDGTSVTGSCSSVPGWSGAARHVPSAPTRTRISAAGTGKSTTGLSASARAMKRRQICDGNDAPTTRIPCTSVIGFGVR